MASVLASSPTAMAKARSCRGLIRTTGKSASARAATQRSFVTAGGFHHDQGNRLLLDDRPGADGCLRRSSPR